MRIRQIKAAFWKDSHMANLGYGARLFYIGLWMLADDAGWLRWDAYEVGCELYGGEPRAARERRITAWLDELVQAGRVKKYPCGHLLIPSLPRHQRVSDAKRVLSSQTEHLRYCPPDDDSRGFPRIPADSRGTATIPADSPAGTERNGRVRNGTERNGRSGRKRPKDEEETSEFRAKVGPLVAVDDPREDEPL